MKKLAYYDDDDICLYVMQVAFGKQSEWKLTTYIQSANFLEDTKVDVPDAMILDASMPRVTGMEIIATLKPLYPEIIFIIHTGDTGKESLHHYRELGFAGIIPKPIAAADIFPLYMKIVNNPIWIER